MKVYKRNIKPPFPITTLLRLAVSDMCDTYMNSGIPYMYVCMHACILKSVYMKASCS